MTWGDIILLSFISGILILEVTPSNFLLYIGILLIIILLIVILIPINTYNKKIYIIIIVCCGTIYNFSYKETITPKYYKNEYREYIKECIIKKYPEQEHHSILLALLIGDKSNIPKELKKSYSNAGVTHLMAVSGLHIGIIYAIINSFLFILNLSYNNKLIKHFIVAIILVIFCYITGFTPSVLRATIMIISYNFINYFCHAKNKYSPLLFSAFIILLINPSSITKIGFMLSFAAMAGIIFIYPTISKSLISNKKNKGVLNYIKRVISLSISCQITTLPICLYYFGNYSPIFIISNIICIPLTTIIILTFICTITFNYIPFIGNYLAQFTNSILIISINSLNDIVNLI